jgi:hypothetical protein
MNDAVFLIPESEYCSAGLSYLSSLTALQPIFKPVSKFKRILSGAHYMSLPAPLHVPLHVPQALHIGRKMIPHPFFRPVRGCIFMLPR